MSYTNSVDWICKNCMTTNFSYRTNCFSCNKPKLNVHNNINPNISNNNNQSTVNNRDWICPFCGVNNFRSRTTCFKCLKTSAIPYSNYNINNNNNNVNNNNINNNANDHLSSSNQPLSNQQFIDRDWMCKYCNTKNFSKRTNCFGCQKSKEEKVNPTTNTTTVPTTTASTTTTNQNDELTKQNDNNSGSFISSIGFKLLEKMGWKQGEGLGSNQNINNQNNNQTLIDNNQSLVNNSNTNSNNPINSRDWICKKCNTNNFGFRTNCFSCQSPKESITTQTLSNNNTVSLNSSVNNSNVNNSRDWICKHCNTNNFGFRMECFNCKKPKENLTMTNHVGNNNANNNDWICKHCNTNNFAFRTNCFSCQSPKQDTFNNNNNITNNNYMTTTTNTNNNINYNHPLLPTKRSPTAPEDPTTLLTGKFFFKNSNVFSPFEVAIQDFLRKGFFQLICTSQFYFNYLNIEMEKDTSLGNELDMTVIYQTFLRKCQMSREFYFAIKKVKDVRNKWAHFQFRKGIQDDTLVIECLECIQLLTNELFLQLNQLNNQLNNYKEGVDYLQKRVNAINNLISTFNEFNNKIKRREKMKLRFYFEENNLFNNYFKLNEKPLQKEINTKENREIAIECLQKLIDKLENNNTNKEDLLNYLFLDLIPQSPFLFEEIENIYLNNKNEMEIKIEEIKMELSKIIEQADQVSNQSNISFDIRLKDFNNFFWFIILNIGDTYFNEFYQLFNTYNLAKVHYKIFKNNEWKIEIYNNLCNQFNISDNLLQNAKNLLQNNFNDSRLNLLFEQYNEFRNYYKILYKGYENLITTNNYIDTIKCFSCCFDYLKYSNKITFPKVKESLWNDNISKHFEMTVTLLGKSLCNNDELIDSSCYVMFIRFCLKPMVRYGLFKSREQLQSIIVKNYQLMCNEESELDLYEKELLTFIVKNINEFVNGGLLEVPMDEYYNDYVMEVIADNFSELDYEKLMKDGSLYYFSADEMANNN
ncbi:hypothetical protein ABK040_008777 [Willaertia magna]